MRAQRTCSCSDDLLPRLESGVFLLETPQLTSADRLLARLSGVLATRDTLYRTGYQRVAAIYRQLRRF